MRITYFGGKQVTFPLPPREPGHIEEPPGFDAKSFGHYPYWTSLAGNLQTRLRSLALGYAATGNPAYADTAIATCLALCEWSIWTDTDYHPDRTTCLDTCYLTMGVAAAYDACFDRMSPEQRAKVRDGLVRLGLEPILRDASRPASQESEFNLEIFQNAALGIGVLAILGEIPDEPAGRYLEQATRYFTRLLDKKLSSPNTEGLSYSSTLDDGFVFADALHRVTGDDSLFRHPYAREVIPRWVSYFLGPNRSGCVNFCDCGGYPWPFVQTLKLLHNNTGSPLAAWFLSQARTPESGGFFPILFANPKRTGDAPLPLADLAAPTSLSSLRTSHFSAAFLNIGWAALRSGWGDGDTLLALKCSSSREGHDHFDAGNFVLNCAGTWLLTDPGYGSFHSKEEGFFGRSTPGHNTLLVDGEAQGSRAGRITDFFSSPRLDCVVGDAGASYDPAKVKRFLRHIAFVRGGYFVVYDEVESAGGPRRFDFLLHTDDDGEMTFDGKPLAEGESAGVRSLVVSKERARVTATLLEPAPAQVRFARYPGAERYPAFAWVHAPEPFERGRFLVALEAAARTGVGLANPGFERGLAGWTMGGEPGNQVEAAVDHEVFRGGHASLRLSGTVAKRDRSLAGQWHMPCEEGKAYRFAIWCKAKELQEGKPVMDVTFYDAAGKHVPPVKVVAGRPGTHDWELLEAVVTAPRGAAQVTLRAGLDWGVGTIWLDDAAWEEVGRPAAAFPAPALQFTRLDAAGPRVAAVQAEGPAYRDVLLFNPEQSRLTAGGVTTDAALAWVRFENGKAPAGARYGGTLLQADGKAVAE